MTIQEKLKKTLGVPIRFEHWPEGQVTSRIGPWEFDPAGNELRRGAERVRLEHRAARALELLCGSRGAVVSQERLLAEVWSGRQLSAHSVPIVIAQLRRALGEDARNPVYIETIPKQGYRLVHDSPVDAIAPEPKAKWIPAAAVAVLLALAAAVAGIAMFDRAAAARPVIGLTEIANQTGTRSYDPLARATDAVILGALTRTGFDVRRGPLPTGVTLQPRLVLWNGEPSVGLTAVGPDHLVRWSGTTMGGASKIPSEIGRNVNDMASALARH